MAGNKNSGRKPKQNKVSSNTTSHPKLKRPVGRPAKNRPKDQKEKQNVTKTSSLTVKKTQPTIDQYIKKTASTPSSTKRRNKETPPIEVSTTKVSSPKKAKVAVAQKNKQETRQFNCPFCNQAFSRKYDMEKHSRKVVYIIMVAFMINFRTGLLVVGILLVLKAHVIFLPW